MQVRHVITRTQPRQQNDGLWYRSTMFISYKFQQALRVIGELQNHRDTTSFHEETFVCRKFFAIGNGQYTTHVHVRILANRPGEILSSRDLQPLFYFLRFLQKMSPGTRDTWLLHHQHIRSFRWASNDCNTFVFLSTKDKKLLVLISPNYANGLEWMQDELRQNFCYKNLVVGWF